MEMKNSLYLLVVLMCAGALFSCQEKFLEKPDTTGTTTIESTFANRAGAEQAMSAAYLSVLAHGLYPDGGLSNGVLPGISGENSYGESWMSLTQFITAGFTAQPYESNGAQSPDNFFTNFSTIRRCYIVLEHVDLAADMSAEEKEVMKAEMKALIAYRYMGMFIRYGGVPIVTKSLTTNDDLNIPRASLQETLDFIIKNADEAAAVLPDSWDAKYNGRFTKGAAMAIKARALLYAARPLFNSATPYLAADDNKLICFGVADAGRWQQVIAANEAVVQWATGHGYALINTGGGINQPDANALADYGTATSTPNNKEVLLAFKFDRQNDKFFEFYNAAFTNERWLLDNAGLLTNFLENYYKADGTDQSWPGTGESNAQPFSEYIRKMNEMEPRFLADNMPHTQNARNNPGNMDWHYNSCKAANCFGVGANFGPSGRGRGASIITKFYYEAGSRNWFEFPLFRMADFYLSLAEAYNEAGNAGKALENLNLVHNRAGLPSITETGKDALRKIIQREWAIEFFFENRRFFDVRHWKLKDIANGLLAGPMRELQMTHIGDDQLPSGYSNFYDNVVYTTYWDPKMYLLPIPQAEIDRGVVVQNPGY